MGRLVGSLATAVSIAVVAAGCGASGASREGCGTGDSCATTLSGGTSASSASQAADTTVMPSFSSTVSIEGLTFTLPAELRFRTDGFTSTGEAIDGYYANVPFGPACTKSCGLPSFNPLPADAVVVGLGVLSGFGAGAPSPEEPAPNTTIAGRDAVLSAEKPGHCGGDETITVRVPNPSGKDINDILLRACLSGPDLSVGEQTIRALLDSATTT